MTDDRGLSALAEALRRQHEEFLAQPESFESRESVAAAILGERGVYLPDGLPGRPDVVDAATELAYEAEIARLRRIEAAARDALDENEASPIEWPDSPAVIALRAALAPSERNEP